MAKVPSVTLFRFLKNCSCNKKGQIALLLKLFCINFHACMNSSVKVLRRDWLCGRTGRSKNKNNKKLHAKVCVEFIKRPARVQCTCFFTPSSSSSFIKINLDFTYANCPLRLPRVLNRVLKSSNPDPNFRLIP